MASFWTGVDDFGGGQVRRAFRSGTRYRRVGEVLSVDELKSMPLNNRRALISKGYIATWPAAALQMTAEDSPLQRFMVHRGFAMYDIVEGRQLNREPLTREQAVLMIGGEPPKRERKPRKKPQ